MPRRSATVAASVAIVVVVLAGSLVVAHRLHAHERALHAVGLIVKGETYSRRATDRPCPGLGPGDDAPPPTIGPLRFEPIATVESPTSAAFLPASGGDGYLAQRAGQVLRIVDGEVTDDVLLDLRDDTLQEGDGGLLALAVDPAAEWLYVSRTAADRDDVISAYPIEADGSLDAGDGREIVRSGHPSSIQHHGGSLAFDDDGHLYFGFGDGGGLGDPRENGQRLSTLLGKISRIEPTPTAEDPYRIPDDNPFVDQPEARGEIWVYGVRNPFRLAYDPGTDALWLGDVGQSCWEEIDRLATGAGGAGGSNLGWDLREGTHEFEEGEPPGRVLDPVFEITHRRGWCAIVTGPVQRGAGVPVLDGRLLVTDYCKGQVWTLDPENPAAIADTALRVENPIAIVPGPAGRPWVLTLGGEVLEIRSG